MATLREASLDVAPASGYAVFRDSGEVVTVLSAAGGEEVGHVVVRHAALQAIGVVQAIHPDSRKVAVTGDELQVRITGKFYAAKATGYTPGDGDRLQWNGTNNNFEADTTGAHQCVGDYATGDTWMLVIINVWPAAATT